MRAWLVSGLVALLGCGGSTVEQVAQCDAGTTGSGGAVGTGGAGGGGSGGGGASPAPAAEVCAELDVTSWSCTPNDYHDPLVSFVRASSVIFRGTVKALDAVTPGLPITDTSHTVIAHVDAVLEAADPTMIAGQDVTIQLLAAPTMAVGYQGAFFTNATMIGQSIAVSEVAHVDLGLFPTLDADVPGIEAMLADERLYARMETAGSVVVGTVSAIETFPEQPPTSEHDPLWAVATIDVDCALRGATPKVAKTAFATSTDVMWFQSPKLVQGQKGVFLLQPVPLPPSPFQLPDGVAYAVTDALDAQPETERAHAAGLVLCPPGE